jgi:hypothetical protein
VLEQCIFFIILTTALLFAGSQPLPITLAPNTLASATDVMNNFTFLKNRAWDLSGTDLYYNDGNVGVGTSTFVDKFHVANGNINLSTGWGIKWVDISTMILGVSGSIGYLTFQTNSIERMRIDPGGNVGIGTNSPGARLDVIGNIRISNNNSVMRANTGPANVVSVAYGNINADGSVNPGGSTGNFTAVRMAPNTGNYQITWTDGLMTHYQNAVVNVTTTYGNPRITSWTSTGGGAILIVRIFDNTGVGVDDYFSFTVFRP